MQNWWGVLMVLPGLLMVLGGLTKSEFVIYRLLVARSRALWGDNVHIFFVLVGLAIVIFGLLIAMGYVKTKA